MKQKEVFSCPLVTLKVHKKVSSKNTCKDLLTFLWQFHKRIGRLNVWGYTWWLYLSGVAMLVTEWRRNVCAITHWLPNQQRQHRGNLLTEQTPNTNSHEVACKNRQIRMRLTGINMPTTMWRLHYSIWCPTTSKKKKSQHVAT